MFSTILQEIINIKKLHSDLLYKKLRYRIMSKTHYSFSFIFIYITYIARQAYDF